MPDYSKGKIYKIVCHETGLIYIGSTCEELKNRLRTHYNGYKSYLNGKYDCLSSFAIIQFGNYSIELIEEYPCESKTELEMREGYWQNQIECINKKEAGAYAGNKKQYCKTYYSLNKDKINKKRKERNKNNKDKINELQRINYKKRQIKNYNQIKIII